MPAVPCRMPGLSNSASAGSVGPESGRLALARVGLAGSFLECLAGSRLIEVRLLASRLGGRGASGWSGEFAIAPIWGAGRGEGSAGHRLPAVIKPTANRWYRAAMNPLLTEV